MIPKRRLELEGVPQFTRESETIADSDKVLTLILPESHKSVNQFW
jgi:hypothetical protein